MNIQIIYDKEDKYIQEYYMKLKQSLNKKNDKFNKINKTIHQKNKYIIVITNNINKYKNKLNIIKKHFTNKVFKIYIITGNLDTVNILECINISKNVSYIKSPIGKTVTRIAQAFSIGL